MRRLDKLLKIAIVTLVIFSSSYAMSNTLAYWSSTVTSSSDTQTNTITIGTWNTGIPTYDPNTSYTTGDIVTYNGSTYQAKKDGILKEPGVGSWKSDWALIG